MTPAQIDLVLRGPTKTAVARLNCNRTERSRIQWRLSRERKLGSFAAEQMRPRRKSWDATA